MRSWVLRAIWREIRVIGAGVTLLAYGSSVDVDYPSFGTIVIDGNRFEHDVVVEAGRVRRRKKGPSKSYRDRYGHTPLSADEDIPWSPP